MKACWSLGSLLSSFPGSGVPAEQSLLGYLSAVQDKTVQPEPRVLW